MEPKINQIPSTRAKVLDIAREAVTKDRAATHGRPEQSLNAIARLWTAFLNNHLSQEGVIATLQLLPHDVALMMSLMKVARAHHNPLHEDNWVDLAGYAACGADVAEQFVSSNAISS